MLLQNSSPRLRHCKELRENCLPAHSISLCSNLFSGKKVISKSYAEKLFKLKHPYSVYIFEKILCNTTIMNFIYFSETEMNNYLDTTSRKYLNTENIQKFLVYLY